MQATKYRTRKNCPDRHGRYLIISGWARRRYTINGVCVIDRGGVLVIYSRIEQAAWDAYIGPARRDENGCLVFPGAA
jgi:hypothetical protein